MYYSKIYYFITISILLLTPFYSIAQNDTTFINDISDEVCLCLDKQELGISEAQVKEAFQNCLMSTIMGRVQDLEDVYGSEIMSDTEKGQQVGQKIGLKVLSDCPKLLTLMAAQKNEDSKPDEAATPEDNVEINELSPTMQELADKTCLCMQEDNTTTFADDDALSDMIVKCIEEEEGLMEQYMEEANLEELSDEAAEQIGVDIAAHLFGTCPSFFRKAYPLIAKEAGLSSEAAGEPVIPTGNLEQDIANSACNCFEKIDIDGPQETVTAQSEQCFAIAAIQNYQGLMNKFGAKQVLEMENDSFLKETMTKTIPLIIKNCEKGKAIIIKLGG